MMNEDGNSYRSQFPLPDWHSIAEKASQEGDPKKLAQLVKALCDRLEELQHLRKKPPQSDAGISDAQSADSGGMQQQWDSK